MAPRAKAAGSLADLVGSDSEPDFDNLNSVSAAANPSSMAVKRARGRPRGTANKIAKPASKRTRRICSRSEAAVSESAREALVDKGNTNSLQGPSSVSKTKGDEEGTSEARPPKTARGRPKVPTSSKALEAAVSAVCEAGTRRAGCSTPEAIAETQEPEPMQLEQHQTAGLDGPSSLDSELGGRDALPGHDMDDALIRRRLGELTKKYDNLEMRHRDLREVGVKAAERNFERLKKQAEENIAASDKLIAHFREELAAQSALAEQVEYQRQQLEHSEANGRSLQANIDELTASLSAARSEIKALSVKLAASRSAEASARAPGSALKPRVMANRTGAPEAVQVAQAKEDLYGDLTGLIVRGLRRGDEEDEFDCIQTGRNGTLHFKLALERRGGSDYDDVQVTYRPQLDADRDGFLMEVLPDYLVEEITFPRPQASKFYSRVIKSLTERTG